jgi:hypothetical protein
MPIQVTHGLDRAACPCRSRAQHGLTHLNICLLGPGDERNRMRTEPPSHVNHPRTHRLRTLRSACGQVLMLAIFGLSTSAGCGRNLDGAACPCVEGWKCCQAENVCVRVSEQCSSLGGGSHVGGVTSTAGSGGSANGSQISLVGGSSSAAGGVSSPGAGTSTANSGGSDTEAGVNGSQAGASGGTSCANSGNVSGVCDACGDIVRCDGSCPVSACLDQSFSAESNVFFLVNEGAGWVGQTYTAARGGRLIGVAVDVSGASNRSYPLRIAVYDANAGMPTTTLGEVTLSTSGSPFGDIVIFANQISQTPGHRYAIGVSYPDAPAAGSQMTQGTWYGSSAGDYVGGEPITSVDGINWSAVSSVAPDLRFATYVTPN